MLLTIIKNTSLTIESIEDVSKDEILCILI